MSKKKKALWIFVAAIAILLIYDLRSTVGTLEDALNYQGVCLKTEKRITVPVGEKLSDKDMIRIAFEWGNRRAQASIHGAKGKNGTIFKLVPFASFEEFMKTNPDCCRIEIQKEFAGDSLDIARWAGVYAGTVRMEYTAFYLDDSGQRQEAQAEGEIHTTNCGIVTGDRSTVRHKKK